MPRSAGRRFPVSNSYLSQVVLNNNPSFLPWLQHYESGTRDSIYSPQFTCLEVPCGFKLSIAPEQQTEGRQMTTKHESLINNLEGGLGAQGEIIPKSFLDCDNIHATGPIVDELYYSFS